MDYRMAGDYTVQQGDLSYGASDYRRGINQQMNAALVSRSDPMGAGSGDYRDFKEPGAGWSCMRWACCCTGILVGIAVIVLIILFLEDDLPGQDKHHAAAHHGAPTPPSPAQPGWSHSRLRSCMPDSGAGCGAGSASAGFDEDEGPAGLGEWLERLVVQ